MEPSAAQPHAGNPSCLFLPFPTNPPPKERLWAPHPPPPLHPEGISLRSCAQGAWGGGGEGGTDPLGSTAMDQWVADGNHCLTPSPGAHSDSTAPRHCRSPRCAISSSDVTTSFCGGSFTWKHIGQGAVGQQSPPAPLSPPPQHGCTDQPGRGSRLRRLPLLSLCYLTAPSCLPECPYWGPTEQTCPASPPPRRSPSTARRGCS